MKRKTLVVVVLSFVFILIGDLAIAEVTKGTGITLDVDTILLIGGQIAFSVYFVLSQHANLRRDLLAEVKKIEHELEARIKENHSHLTKELNLLEIKVDSNTGNHEKAQNDLTVFKVQIKGKIMEHHRYILSLNAQVEDSKRDINDIFNKDKMTRRTHTIAMTIPPLDEDSFLEETT